MLSFIPIRQLSSQFPKYCFPQIVFLCPCPGIYFSSLPSWKILAQFNFVKIDFCYMSTNVWLQVCLYTVSTPGVQGSHSRALDLLELGLQAVGNGHVVAGNLT